MISLDMIKLKALRAMLRYYHKSFDKKKIKVDEITLTIERGIFSPKYTFSSAALLSFLKSKTIRRTFRVVDVGTGSGIIAIFLSSTKKLRWVIASDISIHAAKVSLRNIKDNNLYSYTDVVVCDCLSPFRDSAVDLVISNPPYLPLNPRNGLDMLFCAGEKLEVLIKLVRQSRRCLKRRGTLIFTISSLTPFDSVSKALVDNGFVYIRHQMSRTPFDKIYVMDAILISKED